MSGIYLGPEKRYPPSLRLKRTLAEGKLPQGTVLVIQDFTQVDLESGFVQDLIVCIYSHDESAKDGLGGAYFDFVGEKGLTNGAAFVFAGWQRLFESDILSNASIIYVWSDGGP